MFKISEFARIAQVSTRLLRYYNQIGLLKPEYVDHATGYRYYSLDQLPRLNRILALKDLGLSLDEIRYLLGENLSSEEIRGMLLLKQAELRQLVVEETEKLRRVEQRLQYMQEDGKSPEHDVVIKSLEPLHVLSVRTHLKQGEWVGTIFQEMWRVFREQQFYGTQAILTVYHSSLDVYYKRPPKANLVEAAYVVDEDIHLSFPLNEERQIAPHDLVGYEAAACAIHQGSDMERGLFNRGLFRWAEAHGYGMAAGLRETYLRRGTAENPDDHLTEVQLPLVKREAVRENVDG